MLSKRSPAHVVVVQVTSVAEGASIGATYRGVHDGTGHGGVTKWVPGVGHTEPRMLDTDVLVGPKRSGSH